MFSQMFLNSETYEQIDHQQIGCGQEFKDYLLEGTIASKSSSARKKTIVIIGD